MNTQHNLSFSLDEPVEAQEFMFREVLVRGWAIGGDGPITVAARVGPGPWTNISYGKMRSDVAIAHPAIPNALHSGFNGRLDVSNFTPGEYDVEIQISSSSGPLKDVRRRIQISDATHLSREAVVSLPEDVLRMRLDTPSGDALILQGSILRVTGWAIAKTGVKGLEIWLDSDGPYSVHYGLLREDIDVLYEEFVNPAHAGFLWAWHTAHLEPGTHRIHVVCTSVAGKTAEVTSLFQIDTRTEYEVWASLNRFSKDRLLTLFKETEAFSYTPKISIITPVYRTPEVFLRKCVASVKMQVYPHWELVLVDDCSGKPLLSSLLKAFAAEDNRIRYTELSANRGIAGATNAGLELCNGDFVALLDHDDELSPDALFQVIQTLAKDPSIDVLYSDEDKLGEEGTYREGFFKPDWSPDLLLSMNYVCHFLVCRRSLLQYVDGLRIGFDGSQDYDLILRLSEHTSRIRRIPKVLYHWRIHEQSTAADMGNKPKASVAGRRALEEHLDRTGVAAQVLEIGPGRYRVKYQLQGEPEVAIIIPTGGNPILESALDSILKLSTYKNYRILVVDNSSGEEVQHRVSKFHKLNPAIELLNCKGLPFNFSLLCNRAAKATNSDYFLFLNDDTSISSPDWIESMLEHAQRRPVGVVGALLLFPNSTIQHAGVITGLLEIAGHAFRGLPNYPFYFAFPHVIRNCSAVTGACLMMRRDVFMDVDGFDESNLPTCFQDVDICLKVLEKGFRVVYTPFAKLFHYESLSKRAVAHIPELTFMKKRWPSYLTDDPYYNPNLTRVLEDYSLRYDELFVNNSVRSGAPDQVSVKQRGDKSRDFIDDLPLQTKAAKKINQFGAVSFYSSSGPVKPAALGKTTLHWKAKGADKIQIRVGSPMGNLFAEGGDFGSATTGSWVQSGTIFYLIDATEHNTGHPDRVLSVLRM